MSIKSLVGAIWFSAGALWLFRFSWQVKNPYIEIKNGKIIIRKSPVITKILEVDDLKDIVDLKKNSLKLELKNVKKVKISLQQIKKDQRDDLLKALKGLVPKS